MAQLQRSAVFCDIDIDGQRPVRLVARREFVADAAIALMLFGYGIHAANVIEIYCYDTVQISARAASTSSNT